MLKPAICKLRHCNLAIGIGIGIGTDITDVIFSSSVRPMDPKLSRVVNLDERTPPTKSRGCSILWSRGKQNTLYFHFHKAYVPQTYQGGDLG